MKFCFTSLLYKVHLLTSGIRVQKWITLNTSTFTLSQRSFFHQHWWVNGFRTNYCHWYITYISEQPNKGNIYLVFCGAYPTLTTYFTYNFSIWPSYSSFCRILYLSSCVYTAKTPVLNSTPPVLWEVHQVGVNFNTSRC